MSKQEVPDIMNSKYYHTFRASLRRKPIEIEGTSFLSKQKVPNIVNSKCYLSLQGKSIDIEGMFFWGSHGEEKWGAIWRKSKETEIDTTVSTKQIFLQISMYPIQLFEISKSLDRDDDGSEDMEEFLGNLKDYVVGKGYGLKALPVTKIPLALPGMGVEGEVTKSFECFITEIDDDVAYVTLVDEDGEKSYMEIPLEDLKKNKIEHKPGNIFSFLFKRRGEWEAIELSPIERSSTTKAERDDLLRYYKKKYGDV